jgi:hypothetical protein
MIGLLVLQIIVIAALGIETLQHGLVVPAAEA